MRNALLLLVVVMAAGCVTKLDLENRAYRDMDRSKAAYKACLEAKAASCDTEREIYEADLAAYRAMMGDNR